MDPLPAELLLEIPHHLSSTSDLASLSLTNKHLHLIFNPLLYQRDARSGSPIAPFWGAEHGLLNTLRHAQAAGADVHSRRDFTKPRSEYGPGWRYVEPPTASQSGGQVLRKRRSMSAFLDGSLAAPLPRYWWRPLDAAAFFGHADAVRFLAEGIERAELGRSRGLCAFGLPACGRPGVDVERRLESEWTVHRVMEVARCGGHREVTDVLQELAQAQAQLQAAVESVRKGVVGKGTGVAVGVEGPPVEGSEKDVGVRTQVQAVELGEVEFSYRDFVLERF